MGQHSRRDAENMNTQTWIPLLDYALKNDVSLSTLRRYIKSKKVQYKLEKGRYLLLDQASTSFASVAIQSFGDDSEFLRMELQRAHEEIAELKTLIALYEEKIGRPQSRPGYDV